MTIWLPRLSQSDGPLYKQIADQLQRGVDQDPPEIAMVIGLWRGRPRNAAPRLGGGGFGSGRSGGRTHALFYHHRLVNVSTDYTD